MPVISDEWPAAADKKQHRSHSSPFDGLIAALNPLATLTAMLPACDARLGSFKYYRVCTFRFALSMFRSIIQARIPNSAPEHAHTPGCERQL